MRNIFSKIRNEKGDSSENLTGSKTIEKCYIQLSENICDNGDVMVKFLERHKLAKLTQKENNPIFIK